MEDSAGGVQSDPANRRERRKQRQSGKRVAGRMAKTASGAGIGLALTLAPPVQAAIFSVSNLNDSGAGSLRQAVQDANANPGADAVTFQAGITGTITLTSGQLYITDAVGIQGPGSGALTVSGNHFSRIFYLYSPYAGPPLNVTISGLTLSEGFTYLGGGAILNYGANLTLSGVALIDNYSLFAGGALYSAGTSSVNILNCSISGNTSTVGGGIYLHGNGALIQDTIINDNDSGAGGGIVVTAAYNQVLIDRCTISGNSSSYLGGGISLTCSYGGAVTVSNSTISGNSGHSGGGMNLSSYNAATIENTTISGNTAAANGGGIFLYPYGGATMRFATVAQNVATGSGGGIYLAGSTMQVADAIIAKNTAQGLPDDTAGLGSFDLRYTLVQAPGPNIFDQGGNIFNQDPQLGPLASNGGPTLTMLPAASSPAVNAGDPAFSPPPATDQRGDGFPRIMNDRVDMGAVESGSGPDTKDIPTLNEMGALALIGLLGAAAVLMMRRRMKPHLFLILATLILTAMTSLTAAGNAGRSRQNAVVVMNSLSRTENSVTVCLSDGTCITAPRWATAVHYKAKNRRQKPVPVDTAWLAGKPAVLKIVRDSNGRIRRMQVRVFDTVEEAQQNLARRPGN